MVFIDRGNARDARRKLGDAVDKLRAGATFAAFPEGTRSKDGMVGPFKGGRSRWRSRPACGVAGRDRGRGQVLPPAGFRVRPGTIRVRFGTPIDTAGLQAQRSQCADATRARTDRGAARENLTR